MARRHITLALVTLVSSAPVLAAEPPAGTPDRPASSSAPAAPSAPAESTQIYRTGANPPSKLAPSSDLPVPPTPMPMNLPDDAKASEVRNEYGIGMASLVIGTLLLAAIVVGALYFISRRSWSTQH